MSLARVAAAVFLAATALLSACCSGAPAGTAHRVDPSAVRAATARYSYLANAVADGYYPAGQCMQDARGAMGQHYVNQRYAGRLDPLHPPELFYVPVNGTLRLGGVEYYVPAASATRVPSLFGRPFDGPMPGHAPGQPEHYDLHVWLFIDNPAGLYAPYDPELSCQ